MRLAETPTASRDGSRHPGATVMTLSIANDWKWYAALMLYVAVSWGVYGTLIWQIVR